MNQPSAKADARPRSAGPEAYSAAKTVNSARAADDPGLASLSTFFRSGRCTTRSTRPVVRCGLRRRNGIRTISRFTGGQGHLPAANATFPSSDASLPIGDGGSLMSTRGERLRLAMEARGVRKQQALAFELKVHESAITRWKEGGPLSLSNAVVLCAHLGQKGVHPSSPAQRGSC